MSFVAGKTMHKVPSSYTGVHEFREGPTSQVRIRDSWDDSSEVIFGQKDDFKVHASRTVCLPTAWVPWLSLCHTL